MAAAGRVLETRRLDDVTVVDLIHEAGVSRASFYIYFESKHAAVAARAEEAMAQIYEIWAPWLSGRDEATGLDEVWVRSIALWRERQAVLMAAAEAWRADASVGAAWEVLMQRYAESVRERIEALRAAGAAAPGTAPAILATVLVWLNESAMYMSFRGSPPPAVDDRALAHTLASIWRRVVGEADDEPVHPSARPKAPPDAGASGGRLWELVRRRRPEHAVARQAFLAATEELLRERHLDELTVVDVIERAGFSRATFYAYFASKHAVVAALGEQALHEVYDELWRDWLVMGGSADTATMVAQFRQTVAMWRRHEAVLTATAVGWRTNPDAYGSWAALWHEYAEITTAYIERVRATAEAPGGPDAEILASVLVWLIETLLYVAFTGSGPLADDEVLAEALAAVWVRSIHSRG